MALIFLPLSGTLLWLGWRAVAFQERQNVEQRMTALHGAVAGFMVGGVRVVISAGEALAATPVFRYQPASPPDEQRRRALIALLDRHPTLAAIFVGYPDGKLLYVGRTSTFSPDERREFSVPTDGKILIRTIEGQGAARRASWWFNTPAPGDAPVLSGPSEFDPRIRPWYVAAMQRGASALTDPYAFEWTNEPGVSAGVPIEGGGVIGFDFTLGTLGTLLASYKITPNSIIVVGSKTSDVTIESEPCEQGAATCMTGNTEVRAKLREAVVAPESGGRRLERTIESGGRDYRLIAQEIPPVIGKSLTVAAAVPVVELSAGSRILLERAAAAAAGTIVLAILAVFMASVLLSRPLATIAAKTERIRQLDFSGHVPVTSRITEILKLATAIERMREGLEVFGLYVSKELVGEIMRAPGRTGLGGTRRELSVMFTDIEGFSRITENIEPELLTSRLSRYFEALGEPISANRGMIDKYIGDSIMAFWNAPQPDPDHVFHACRAALAASAASRRLALKWSGRGRPAFRTRIGLHKGPAVVGNVGARNRINYTLVGAVANQASRLESLNKIYGTEILAGGEVATATADRMIWRPIDRIVAAGTTEVLDIHELMGETGAMDDQTEFLGRWEVARSAYREGRFAAAIEAFQVVVALRPGDRPSVAFIERCTRLMEAPPATWDGVWHFEKK
jgi:adenylate cyclase